MVQVRCKVALPCCPLHMAHACYLELQCPAQCFSLRCQSNGVLGHSHFPGGTLKGAKLKVSACSILWASETRLSRKKKKVRLFNYPGSVLVSWELFMGFIGHSRDNNTAPAPCPATSHPIQGGMHAHPPNHRTQNCCNSSCLDQYHFSYLKHGLFWHP